MLVAQPDGPTMFARIGVMMERNRNEAAKAFGCDKRNAEPKSMADDDWLMGWGCAITCYRTQMASVAARVRLQRDGRNRAILGMTEVSRGPSAREYKLQAVIPFPLAEGL